MTTVARLLSIALKRHDRRQAFGQWLRQLNSSTAGPIILQDVYTWNPDRLQPPVVRPQFGFRFVVVFLESFHSLSGLALWGIGAIMQNLA
eukprot:TRINITY_DN36342_c0_g1_i1.p1 TRINITY_DN36342_c0_g1~~TRINITY_DN36342_c0_g1_i1.p1  ORF type:complete len:101 (-),score=4.88 TRINITY_DN36342_c0_g1_i1:47-316(-)